VFFVEQIEASACTGADGSKCAFQDSVNLQYFRATMESFGLAESSSLICRGGREVYGRSIRELKAAAGEGCLLFNLSGHLDQAEVKTQAECKVYYDDDPGYTQFWHAAGDNAPRLAGHDFYFTLGRNIGHADCPIPTGGIHWRPTRPPVTLAEWPRVVPAVFGRFTTVASWRGAYAPAYYAGKTYGLKAHEFRKFFNLPRKVGGPFEIALQIHAGDTKDLESLKAACWQIVDPVDATHSPEAFQHYVRSSGAEFSVAQGVYVDTNSGWFSDRTVRYLASGRPVLVQDTGLSGHYPIGCGLVTFRTLEEAVEGAQRIISDYPRHAAAARDLAETFFDSARVIGDLLSDIGLKQT